MNWTSRLLATFSLFIVLVLIALAWLLHRPAPVIPIVGARNLDQMDQNLACVDLELDAESLTELDALSPPAPTFPESLLAMPPLRTMVHGPALVERLVPWNTD